MAAVFKSMIRYKMFFKLFLIFTIVPVVELYLIIEVGSRIGALNTISLVIVTAAVGAYMVKLEGLGVMARLQRNMQDGVFPAEELLDGMLLLVAGALLLTPGFLTDVFGFLAVFPLTRGLIKKVVKKYMESRMEFRPPDEFN